MEVETIRSRIDELSNFLANSATNSVVSSSDSDSVLQDCVQALETNVKEIVSEHSDVGFFKDEDLDAYMDSLRDELRTTEAESASLSNEIESLKKLYMEGTCQLESNLESLRHLLEHTGLEGLGLAKTVEHVDRIKSGEGQPEAKALHEDYFEVLNLKHQIEMNNATLKSMEDLDLNLKRIEVIENIEEALTGLKVIDLEGNIIRVSLKTYIPDVEGEMCRLNAEDNSKQCEVNHELLIEVIDGTMDLKNVEIFPNDVYIGEIAEAANTFRHSFEYLDKDELIVAHMNGGIDAFIKPSQGWPLSISPLKLFSFLSSNQNAKEISLSLLSKVELLSDGAFSSSALRPAPCSDWFPALFEYKYQQDRIVHRHSINAHIVAQELGLFDYLNLS
uniref:Uncharacterized protein n=1 Tax=Chenopodium quinoa TaxID=63459 RepID=A0A803LTM6_CHEQI